MRSLLRRPTAAAALRRCPALPLAAAAARPVRLLQAMPALRVSAGRQLPAHTHAAALHSHAATAAAPAASVSAASPAAPASLPPSQVHIRLPQLSPRMEHGRIARWLVKEGEMLQPQQVFLHVETSELTEDGSPYLLEVESHESGLLRQILQPASGPLLQVGAPIALFEDPDWSAGDPPRGEFLWQAYVMQGSVLPSGECSPQRKEEQ